MSPLFHEYMQRWLSATSARYRSNYQRVRQAPFFFKGRGFYAASGIFPEAARI